VHRYNRSLRILLVASAGVATALGVASLTQTASGQGGSGTSTTSTTSTTATSTTSTSTTSTTTTPKAVPKPKPKPKAVTRTITCKAKLYATRPPVSTALEFANLSCGSPLGKGVQHNSATVASNPERTSGSFSGNVRLFFNEGALRGTYKTTFSVASGTVSYTGKIKVTSGTGDFRGTKGTGTIKGTSTDGLSATLTEKLTLTFPPDAG
jgi:hypothetical protein